MADADTPNMNPTGFETTDDEDRQFSFEANQGQENSVGDDTDAADAPAAEAEPEAAPEEAKTPEADQPSEDAEDADQPDGDDKEGAEEQPEEEEKPNRKPSRAERRIKSLTAEKKELLAEREELLARLNAPAPTEDMNGDPFNFDLPEGEELTPEEYQKHVVATADKIARARVNAALTERDRKALAQNQVKQVEADFEYIQETYPELNENSDNYDAAWDQKLSEAYAKASNNGTNGLSMAEFVDDAYAAARMFADKQTSQMSNSLAKQAAESALTPSPSPEVERSFNDLSDEEMEERLGFAS